MKKIMLIAVAALLLPVLAWAQFRISGRVTDTAKQPLVGATITVGTITTQTDGKGNFSLSALNPAIQLIKISYIGFITSQQTVDLTQKNELNVILERSDYVTDEVQVRATRASSNSATTHRNLDKAELERNNLGQDLPYLLNQTPSVVVSSDAGTGVGYTAIRIRGSDPTRVNVTINGIPFNDTESQGSFFVDVPDFASSVDNIQVQRGVGTSTNGAGAFGGSINIQTNVRRDSAYAELNNTYGSFSTWKNTVLVGTGLLKNKFSVDARLSHLRSDGYIDRASAKLKSYFLSGAYYGKNDLLRINVFSGNERTYQAWNGIPESKLETDRTFNPFFYADQVDDYKQDHSQLLYSHTFNSALTFNAALHYTHGRGFYEEFRDDQKLSDYGIEPVVIGATTISRSNLIRRRWLDNDFYGTTWSLDYAPASAFGFVFGGAYNKYNGNHFGQVIWAEYASNSTNKLYYYDGDGIKTDFNVFGKASYRLGKANLFADLQYRHIGYSIGGTDKNRLPLAQDDDHNFFNPKIGVSIATGERSNVYASFAVANKEPNRDDYVNSTVATRPASENLKDFEAGYRVSGNRFSAGVNGFAMLYDNQLIATGKINDVGEYVRQNVADSYRLGVELDAKLQFTKSLSWGVTGALSRNRIKDFTAYDDDYDNGGQLVSNFKDTRIALSPSFVGSSEFSLQLLKRAEIALLSKYVSRQFLDNTANSARAIDAFFVNDVRLRYTIESKLVKNIGITLMVNNVLSEQYESNGYTFSYLYGGDYTTENYYFPQATRNFLLGVNLKF